MLFTEPVRDPDELLTSALAVIDRAFVAGAVEMLPLFSGGHDSICATHLASQHPGFGGAVYHIDTGIGSKRTREFVEEVCREYKWRLNVYRSPSTYEGFVRSRGFPGPGMHRWAYVRLKERCVRQMLKGRGRVALVTGCRKFESTRRMGSIEPIKVGEEQARKNRKTGRKRRSVVNLNRVWTSPCFDWSVAEQAAYMDAHDLPKNPLKLSLGMSGECFCGAFASPGELNRIRVHAPDVAAEIDRLAGIARECGKHAAWGTRPDRAKGVQVSQTGPLCTSCDVRAASAGLLFDGI